MSMFWAYRSLYWFCHSLTEVSINRHHWQLYIIKHWHGTKCTYIWKNWGFFKKMTNTEILSLQSAFIDRLNKLEYVVFKMCRFFPFLKDQFLLLFCGGGGRASDNLVATTVVVVLSGIVNTSPRTPI